MIHLLKVPDHPPLRTPENPSQKEWEEIARAFYRFKYTYYERTPEDIAWIKAQHEWLKATMPAELREGVHPIEIGGGFMGEDVYVVDGDFTHTTHVQCHACLKFSLVWRGRGSADDCRVWCITCAKPSQIEVLP